MSCTMCEIRTIPLLFILTELWSSFDSENQLDIDKHQGCSLKGAREPVATDFLVGLLKIPSWLPGWQVKTRNAEIN